MSDSRPVVFFHVMKCGGMSVRAALAVDIAGHREGPNVFELDGRASKAAAGGSVGADWQFRDALLPYVVTTLRPAVVLGHFRYRAGHEPLFDAAHLVTVLRDPVERLVSLYHYRRHRQGVDLPVSASLEEQISSRRWAIEGHRYVDTFAGRDDVDPRSDEAIALAVDNLRRFAVVGALERLDAFSSDVSTLLGTRVSIPVLNTSPVPDPGTEIDPGLLEQIREMCAVDSQIYEEIIRGTGPWA